MSRPTHVKREAITVSSRYAGSWGLHSVPQDRGAAHIAAVAPPARYFFAVQTKVARAGSNSGQFCMDQSVSISSAIVLAAHSCCASLCSWARALFVVL